MTTQNQWQPIETAPRDGTDLLLANKEGQYIGGWEDWGWEIGMDFSFVPSHWMPLPLLPEESFFTPEGREIAKASGWRLA